MAELDGAVLAMPVSTPPEEALQAKHEDEQAVDSNLPSVAQPGKPHPEVAHP
jgi:hypothetical protein